MSKQTRYQKRQNEKGLCRLCARPAIGKGYYCAVHHQKQNEYLKRRLKYRMDNGLCRKCGAPLDEESDGNSPECMNCRLHLGKITWREYAPAQEANTA